MKMKFDPITNPMWMSTEVGTPLFSWCLCIDERAYEKVLSQMAKQGKRIRWNFPEEPGHAICQFVFGDNDEVDYCFVLLKETDNPVENATILVHEAVHIWQEYAKSIRENSPSDEFMAYTIQNITKRLFDAYKQALEWRSKK